MSSTRTQKSLKSLNYSGGFATANSKEHTDPKKCGYLDETPRSCSISHLPSDIILYIYDYLTPLDLLTMAEIGNQRLKDLTFCVHITKFSSCHKTKSLGRLTESQIQVKPDISSYFYSSRTRFIKEINFNGYIYITPQVLTEFICQCKNLVELSIVGSGIDYENLVNILRECSNTEKLAWNPDENGGIKVVSPNMKTVNLFCDITTYFCSSIYCTLRNFPNVENAWIYLIVDGTTPSPFVGSWHRVASLTNPDVTKRYTLISNQLGCNANNYWEDYMEILNAIVDPMIVQHVFEEGRSEELSIYKDPPDFDNSMTFISPPYMQIKSNVKDASMSVTGPCNAFKYLSVILTPEIIAVSENIVKYISYAAGANLKQLSLQSEDFSRTDLGVAQNPISTEESFVICDVLEKIVMTSIYITDLNLTTVHFITVSPFEAISKLKFLRSLNTPSCAIKSRSQSRNEISLSDECIKFHDVVKACVWVERLTLNGCPEDYARLSESDFNPLADWKELRCLSIYSLSLPSYSFLRRVAESCEKMHSLSLIALEPKNMQIYQSDITYAVQKSKKLSFIQVNERKFNPWSQCFWDAIGESSKLEGICILTDLKPHVIDERDQIALNAVGKLKCLHVFHYERKRCTALCHAVMNSFREEIKKSMLDNGVASCKVEFATVEDCKHSTKNLYYHYQPSFSCQHLHF